MNSLGQISLLIHLHRVHIVFSKMADLAEIEYNDIYWDMLIPAVGLSLTSLLRLCSSIYTCQTEFQTLRLFVPLFFKLFSS